MLKGSKKNNIYFLYLAYRNKCQEHQHENKYDNNHNCRSFGKDDDVFLVVFSAVVISWKWGAVFSE